MRQMVEAVEQFHEQGLVHLDIKPDNFIVKDEGQDKANPFQGPVPSESLTDKPKTIRLIDFGISKKWKNGDEPLKTNSGTEKYMSPEQKTGNGFNGVNADIYSLGITFYKMICGYDRNP